jgi:hypothetical protein
VTILIHEQELYARAAARTSMPPRTLSTLKSGRNNPGNLWFWSLFFGLALMIGGIVFTAGIQKTIHTARWSQPPDGLLLYLIMAIVGGLGLIWHGWTVQQRKRLIEGIPTSPIRSLALGLVEINGRAETETELLTTPFGGLPCVFYSYTVEEQVQSGKHTRWKTIVSGTSEQPFFVRDETGRVLVVPFGANLLLPDERASRTSWLGELPPLAVSGLSRLGVAAQGWMGDKTLRCRESFILPNESIYVMGTALEHPGMIHNTANESRLYIGSSRDHAFIISDRSEKDLVSQLTWQLWGGLLGGIALLAACVAIIFDRYLTTAMP